MNENFRNTLDVNETLKGYHLFEEKSGTTLIVLNEVLGLLEL
jgi:hypothetical protein